MSVPPPSVTGVRRPAQFVRCWINKAQERHEIFSGARDTRDAQIVNGELRVYWGFEQIVVGWVTGRVGPGAKNLAWFLEEQDLAAFARERRELLGRPEPLVIR